MPKKNSIDVFYERITKTDECWYWTGSVSTGGYGQVGVEGIRYLAHRFSWILTHGPIPDGLWVLHDCDNRLCVNPDHLFLGSSNDNVQDCVRKHRHARGETSGKRKLTQNQVNSIRREYANGRVSKYALAKKYRTTRSNITFIVNRVTWKD